MTAISNRQPPVLIEYDCRGKRKRKSFTNAHEGKAFYQLKLKAGRNPKVCKPQKTIMAMRFTKEQLEQRQLKQAITRKNEILRRNCLTLACILLT